MGLFLTATPAPAAETTPWWHLNSGSRPTDLAPEAKGELILTAANLGDAEIDGYTTPVTISDTVPAGLKVLSVQAFAGSTGGSARGPVECTHTVSTATCIYAGTYIREGEVVPKTLPSYMQIEARVKVQTLPGAESGEANQLAVSGGGALPAQLSQPISLSEDPVPFGVEAYELTPEQADGAPATQAGSHPFQLTTTIILNQEASSTGTGGFTKGEYKASPAVSMDKDVHFRWPAGLLGNPSPLPRCTLAQFLQAKKVGGIGFNNIVNSCPPQTAVGVTEVTLYEPAILGYSKLMAPIFSIEPATGQPARFGFYVETVGIPVLIEPSLRSGSGEDNGITVSVTNLSQVAAFLSSRATVWGVPGDPRHDRARGWGCMFTTLGFNSGLPCTTSEDPHPPAFLTLPTSCPGSPLQTGVQADSWADPLSLLPPFSASPPMPTLDGCNQLPFAPTIHAEATSDAATSPTGLSFDLNFNDEGLLNHEGLAQSQLKKAVVSLPQGFTTNPSVAEGLHACSLAAYESETVNSEPGSGCPNDSKVGDVEIESPLIAGKKVFGGLFVAKQGENPYNNLLTLYLVAREPEAGVIVKQALKVTPDPQTGQLTTEVDNIPQLPFSHFGLSFRQGQRSPLITPPACGTYTVQADLYPWSEPNSPIHRENSFQITQGPEGQGCPSGGVPPFHPNLEAGTLNNAAGTYSPFYAHITRHDSEQEITHFSIKLPPGVSGKLAGIPFCSEAGILQAEEREHEGGGGEEEQSPSCPQASEIGRTNVGTGVGNVLAYAPGKLYLAGPYHGAPISIVSITAAKVGPFDLGTVVVREALKVNPETAEVFVDATGSDPIPHIVDGIPVHLRDIRIYVNRPEFTLNPTSCEKTSTASTVLGSGLNFASEADDVPVTVTSPFQAADCAALPFKPKLKLSLLGGTRRGAHPKLRATLTMRPGEANIAYSQVTLPHAAFLDQSHINTVCTRVQFKAGAGNGAECPAGSIYGYARAITPILDQPLEGPVYLRSSEHKLPDLVAALHNGQINIDLVGRIDSVKGRIRNTFEAVPDAPVSKFVLTMQGAAKGLIVNSTDLCAGTQRAIVDFTAHNGKVSDTTPAVGAKCPKAHKKGRPHHKRHGKRAAPRHRRGAR